MGKKNKNMKKIKKDRFDIVFSIAEDVPTWLLVLISVIIGFIFGYDLGFIAGVLLLVIKLICYIKVNPIFSKERDVAIGNYTNHGLSVSQMAKYEQMTKEQLKTVLNEIEARQLQFTEHGGPNGVNEFNALKALRAKLFDLWCSK